MIYHFYETFKVRIGYPNQFWDQENQLGNLGTIFPCLSGPCNISCIRGLQVLSGHSTKEN